MTLETVVFLLNVVNSLSLSASAENFAEVATAIQNAKSELDAEVVRLTENTVPADVTPLPKRARK